MQNHFTKDGRLFIIRRPIEDDAEAIIKYSKLIFGSTDQVLTLPEEYYITTEEEILWIKSLNNNPNAILLIAELNKEIIGMLFFIPNQKIKNAHTGEFGLNVHPDFQGVGIGKILILVLLKWAKENQQIEKVSLSVFASNINAINLYKNLGFKEEGRLVKAIKQPSGEYVDIIQMYIETM